MADQSDHAWEKVDGEWVRVFVGVADRDVATSVAEKTCSGCRQAKPLGEFWVQRASRDGLQPRCKQCMRNYHQGYIARARIPRESEPGDAVDGGEPLVDGDGNEIARHCTRCGVAKPLGSFYANRTSRGGRDRMCKACRDHQKVVKKRMRDERKAAIGAAAADAVAASLSGGRGERIDADADEIVVRLAAAADRWRGLEDHEEREQAKAVVVYHAGRLLEAVAGQPA